MKNVVTIIALLLISTSLVRTQILNAGFENWTSGEPNDWSTDNISTIYVPITQTTDVHSGSFAIKGSVINVGGGGYAPLVSGYSTISAHYGSLTGYYKFTQVGGDFLSITALMLKNGSAIGTGTFTTGSNISSYTQFTANIEYYLPGTPDSAWIVAFIDGVDSVNIGSTFFLDDLAFGAVTGVTESAGFRPNVYSLTQNYPNPFNPTTEIGFNLPSSGFTTLKVFNVLGVEVTRILEGDISAGSHTVSWNASPFPSGMYYYQLRSNDFVETKRMVLIK